MGAVTLVLGGSRSGKSRHAERLAATAGAGVVYVATAIASDDEMAERIARHRDARPPAWQTVEAAYDLDLRLPAEAADGDCVLIDCLSVWLSNELLRRLADTGAEPLIAPAIATAVERELDERIGRLVAWAERRAGATIIVSNEVGSGVVPASPLGRLYRDLLGRANQTVAAAAAATYLVVAGIAIDLRRLAGRETDAGR